MSIPKTAVHWAGATPAGTPVNPVVIITTPLIAAQLALLAETEEFAAAAKANPIAYGGLMDLLQKITNRFALDGVSNPAHTDVSPKMAAEAGLHYASEPEAASVFSFPSGDPGAGIHEAVQQLARSGGIAPEQPGVKYQPGRVRMPRSLGSLGVHLSSGGSVND